MKFPIRSILFWILCIGLATMWFSAAWFKIQDPSAFAKVIYHYRILPDGFPVNATAIFLPWLEVSLAIALLLPRLQGGAARLSTFLMIFFTLLIVISIFRGVEGSCGCMQGQRIGWLKASENLLLTILSWGTWRLGRSAPPRPPAPPSTHKCHPFSTGC